MWGNPFTLMSNNSSPLTLNMSPFLQGPLWGEFIAMGGDAVLTSSMKRGLQHMEGLKIERS